MDLSGEITSHADLHDAHVVDPEPRRVRRGARTRRCLGQDGDGGGRLRAGRLAGSGEEGEEEQDERRDGGPRRHGGGDPA